MLEKDMLKCTDCGATLRLKIGYDGADCGATLRLEIGYDGADYDPVIDVRRVSGNTGKDVAEAALGIE